MDINFKKTYYIMKCGEVFFFYEFEFISKLFWSNTTLLSCDHMFHIPMVHMLIYGNKIQYVN